jgi:hypothetical protein
MEGARYLEAGSLTIFIFRRWGTYYARIRTSASGKYVWRSLKTTDEQTAIVACGLQTRGPAQHSGWRSVFTSSDRRSAAHPRLFFARRPPGYPKAGALFAQEPPGNSAGEWSPLEALCCLGEEFHDADLRDRGRLPGTPKGCFSMRDVITACRGGVRGLRGLPGEVSCRLRGVKPSGPVNLRLPEGVYWLADQSH